MNTSIRFVREDLGARTLLRSCLLPSTVNQEALLVLVECLNDFPSLPKGKSFTFLAGGEARFTAYPFGKEGYVLEGKLEQVKIKGQSFLFKDPYGEAEKAFNNLFTKNYDLSEKEFAVAKERVLSSLAFDKKDSKKILSSSIAYPHAPLLVDEAKVKELKKEDVLSVLAEVEASKTGRVILYSSDAKEKPLAEIYSNPLLREDIEAKEIALDGDFEADTLGYLFSMKKLEKSANLSLFNLFSKQLIERAKSALSRVLGSPVAMEVKLISPSQFLLLLTAEKGKLSYLGKNNPFEPYAPLEKTGKEKEKQDNALELVSLLKDEDTYYEGLEEALECGFEDADTLLTKKEFKQEDIDSLFASLKEEAAYKALANRKEQA